MTRLDDIGFFIEDDREGTCLSSSETVCLGSKECLTQEEEKILANMRDIRKEALDIKNRLANLEGSTALDESGCENAVQGASYEYQALIDKLDDLPIPSQHSYRIPFPRLEA